MFCMYIIIIPQFGSTIGIAKLGDSVLQWVSGYSALYIDQSLIPQAEFKVGLSMLFPLHHSGLPTTRG